MKYISLIIVVLFIAFTAWFSNKTEELTYEQMNKMNNLIQQYMTQAVQNHNPKAESIDFSKVHTVVKKPGREMEAQFSFSYMEPNDQGDMEKVYRKGTFMITSEDGKKWTAQIKEAGDVKVEFMEPFEISEDAVNEPEGENSTEETPTDNNDNH